MAVSFLSDFLFTAVVHYSSSCSCWPLASAAGWPGYSLLRPLPEDRTLFFSCWFEDQCLASIRGSEKYIHHYGNQPDEVFDLSEEPLEQRNLVSELPKQEMAQRREELLEWRSSMEVTYGGHTA